ncbi:sugar transferase [Galbitalea sp. SE-J8]|uniref:sugar transferase n=1 Tax=Galbitalea sp. SE-J8 TaxID=3054952 RepID=UPI00259CC3A5|nr:sugar transferase [Galbitalea sp. SE-J8]MDM4763927.1 sugar transferase [Galbitalea sp. SE-J8]
MTETPARAFDWARRYARGLIATDAIVIVWAVFGSQLLWFGSAQVDVSVRGRFSALDLNYSLVSALLSIAWFGFISAAGSRSSRVVGFGSTEYQRIINPSLMCFGLFAIIAYLSKIEIARGYFLAALPIGGVALLISRWVWRQYLTVRRAGGELSARVVLVGTADSVAPIARDLISTPQAGYTVVGAFLPKSTNVAFVPDTDVPVLGDIGDVSRRLDEVGADTVVVTSADKLSPATIRRLSWSLEPGRQHLVVAPGLVDVAGPRIHTRPVAGLPLIHVETPRYEGGRRVIKRLFDIVAGVGLLIVLSAPLAAIALTIRLSSDGPVFFRQPRVGLNGSTFTMLKFRSMVVDAERLLADLRAQQTTEGNDVMFKMANDPRVTPIGRVLRRYSLDELPQIFNVLKGDMSLVGPRPPLVSEVEAYETHVNRRFLVTPGITGLWQVSGRSNLSWTETVRLDLYYVENWSLTGDLVILWRTVRAVFARDGAY